MKLVEIVWHDAFDLSSGWMSVNDVEFNCPADQGGQLARTVGWLVTEDDYKVVVATTWAPEPDGKDEESLRGIFVIPRGMVQDIIER